MVRLEQPKIIYHLPDFPLKPSQDKGGIYAILPYERLDKHKKALFKVGLANNFARRFDQYHTYYPFGFYYKNLLANPVLKQEQFYTAPHHEEGKRPTVEEREHARYISRQKYLHSIEKHIFADIEKEGGDRLLTSTRVQNADKKKSKFGETEWFYTDEKTLDHAFDDAFKIYGKNNQSTNYSKSLSQINKNADRTQKQNEKDKSSPFYNAEIHYKIYK